MANYVSSKTGAEIDASVDVSNIAITTSNTGITSNGDVHLNGGNLTRSAFNVGHLEGGQDILGFSGLKTNPIYIFVKIQVFVFIFFFS